MTSFTDPEGFENRIQHAIFPADQYGFTKEDRLKWGRMLWITLSIMLIFRIPGIWSWTRKAVV